MLYVSVTGLTTGKEPLGDYGPRERIPPDTEFEADPKDPRIERWLENGGIVSKADFTKTVEKEVKAKAKTKTKKKG